MAQQWQLNTKSDLSIIRKHFNRNPVLVGKEGEINLKRNLAAEGILVEIGNKMNLEDRPIVQEDSWSERRLGSVGLVRHW